MLAWRIHGADWDDAVESHPEADVWVLTYSGSPSPEALLNALADFEVVDRLESRRCKAERFRRILHPVEQVR